VIAAGAAAQPHRHKQQPQPTAHQKAEGPLHIDLGQGDQRGHHRRGAPHHHQHALHKRAQLQQRLQPQQHPGAPQHHHRVAQDRGGQRALHRLIQPEVQGNLGALAHRASDQGQQDQGEARRQGLAVVAQVGGPGLQAMEIPGAGHRQQGDHAGQQDQVADALGEEGVAGPLHHQRLVGPGAHDQVGAQGEQFQDHVAEEQRVGEHQGAETRLEEAERTEEARPAPVHLQVADRIDLHQQVQAGDHRHGNQGRLAHQAVEADAQASGVQPGPAEAHRPVEGFGACGRVGVEGGEGHQAVAEGHGHHHQVEIAAGARARARNQAGRPGEGSHGRQERIERDQPGRLEESDGHGRRLKSGQGGESSHRERRREWWPGNLGPGPGAWVSPDTGPHVERLAQPGDQASLGLSATTAKKGSPLPPIQPKGPAAVVLSAISSGRPQPWASNTLAT
jgi:hypothetical protein